MRRLLPLLALLPGSALAEAFTPPVPEAQTDAAAPAATPGSRSAS